MEWSIAEVFELSNTCRKVNVDVAKYDEVEVRSSRTNEDRPPVLAGSSCKAFFETSLPDHGLCIRMYGIMLGSHARLDFQTGPYAPEKVSSSPQSDNNTNDDDDEIFVKREPKLQALVYDILRRCRRAVLGAWREPITQK